MNRPFGKVSDFSIMLDSPLYETNQYLVGFLTITQNDYCKYQKSLNSRPCNNKSVPTKKQKTYLYPILLGTNPDEFICILLDGFCFSRVSLRIILRQKVYSEHLCIPRVKFRLILDCHSLLVLQFVFLNERLLFCLFVQAQ